MMRRCAVGVLAAAFVFGVSGCVNGRVDPAEFPDLTLREAREIQNAQLQEFIDLVPQDQVTETWGPIPEASALSCDGDLEGKLRPGEQATGTVMLPGGADVYVADTFDVWTWITGVAAEKEALGWEVERRTDYLDSFVVYSPEGFRYSIAYAPKKGSGRQSITMSSFSPCFFPPSDFTLRDEY